MVDDGYINTFKNDLAILNSHQIYEKYVIPDECKGWPALNDGNLRQIIADHFGLAMSRVFIVGSAKLGFTLIQKRVDEDNVRPRFSPFSDASDVDVAIVSEGLFDDIWKLTFNFWHSSGYDENYWRTGRDFREFIFRGWMRPDKLPAEGNFTYKRDWFDYFRELTNQRIAGDYKISAGLYRDLHFLEHYQHIAIDKCRRAGELV